MTANFTLGPVASPKTLLALTEDGFLDTSRLARCPMAARNLDSSPLLRLPAEIRNMVFTQVVPSGIYSISTHTSNDKHHSHILTTRWYFDDDTSGDYIKTTLPTTSMIHLGLTCGQIYEDTKFLQYARNGFFFSDDAAMRFWISCRSSTQLRLINLVQVPRDATRDYMVNETIVYKKMFVGLQMLCVDAARLLNDTETRAAWRMTLEGRDACFEQKRRTLQQKEGDEVEVVLFRKRKYWRFV